jgi:TolB-like protein/tetratricopeptide (TPR) repeat protein
MNFVSELQRRKVFKVGAAYLVVAWLAVQAASIAFPTFEAPLWALRVFILVCLLGFPLALVMAWIFDATPEGMKVDGSTSGNKLVYSGAALLIVLALGWYFYGQPTFRKGDVSTPVAADQNSIAVLPFANMSSKADDDYFSDGMTEELLNVLAKVPQLQVVARTSVFQFKNKGGDVRDIGRQLGVGHIVEGSVRRDGQEVRITAQLVRVSDGFHVWSETYDRKLEGVFALQDEIAARIGQQLVSSLVAPTAKPARAEIPPEAYDAYLKGRALYRKRQDMGQAVALFRDAVARAPNFADGWSSLSLTYETVAGYVTPEQLAELGDPVRLCREAALRANALDPDSAMTLHAMANVARLEYRYADAERLYLRSMQVDPTYPDVREDYSETLNFVGRDQDALDAAQKLVALEPFVRNFWSKVYFAAIGLDRSDLVLDAAAHIRAIEPHNWRGIGDDLGLQLAWGRIDLAQKALAAAVARDPKVMADDVVLMQWATRQAGVDENAVRRILAYTDPLVYMAIRGESDPIFARLEDRNQDPSIQMQLYQFLRQVPAQRLLADPRAKKLLRAYGFEAYWREKGWPALCHPVGNDDFECGAAAGKN